MASLKWYGHVLEEWRGTDGRLFGYRFSLGALTFMATESEAGNGWEASVTLMAGSAHFESVKTVATGTGASHTEALDCAAKSMREYLEETRTGLRLIGVYP